MISIGLIFAVYLFMKRSKKEGYNEDHIFNLAIFAIISGVIGAKLLYIIVESPSLIKEPSLLLEDFGSGFVFYGAILGGVLGAYIYAKRKKWSFIKVLDIAMPSVPLAQAFGRIGCFFAGCCYGKETTSPWGIEFNNSPFAPHDVHLIPTQVISSVGNFLIFAAVMWFDRKKKTKDGQTCAVYMILYSIARFAVEFLRGDDRGTIFKILSTSQFICILVLIAGLVIYFKAKKPENKDTQEISAE
jgi:phosphatidylglycerol:prolipoprotein diacylglycerol transferase